jgi:FkbM family methyltransferase
METGVKQQLINIIQSILYKSTGFRLVKQPAINESIDAYTTIQRLLLHHAPKHVCDIGSNTGLWFEVLAKYDKEIASAVFFEPQQKYQRQLQRFSQSGIKTQVFKMGISDVSDTLTIRGGNACASFLDFNNELKDTFTGALEDETETVPVDTLDAVYRTHNLVQPDLIKIDVQGLELKVLNGANAVLENCRMLVIELSTQEFYQGQERMWEVLKAVDNKGFTLVDIGYIWREHYDHNKRMLQWDGIFMKL